MDNQGPHPLLVTGAHRTGTTWVGKMLAANPRTAYISEPLNVLHRPGVFRTKVRHWYEYLRDENEDCYLNSFYELLSFRYHLLNEIKSLRSRKDFLRMGRDLSIFLRGRIFHQRALLKDPFAVFSLPWFAERLHSDIVVTVRHPAAFASSLKRLDWPFDFADLLDQPLLMRDHLEPYRKDMQSIAKNDIVGQAALLWTMIYRVVHSTREWISSIRVVRHEDLSLNPVAGFRNLYAELGLDFTPLVERTIFNFSSSENPGELSRKKVHSVKLHSRANLDNWKHRLSSEEIARIHNMTGEVSHLYYPEASWT